MNIFLYIIIFIIGCFFGSFFTLAVYRIPKKEDILIKHSYCPNCNNKLGFFDLFPVLSYIFLGGKCRYCKVNIRPRYLILEILSGLTFLILAILNKVTIYNNCNLFISFAFLILYISVLFIIAGIDKENLKIEKSVLIFGYIIEIIYIIYQYTLGIVNVYQYVIYLLFMIILLILSNINLKIKLRESYWLQNLFLSLYIIVFCGSNIYILTVLATFIIIIFWKILLHKKEHNLPIAYFLAISNILLIIVSKLVINWII